MKTKFLALVLAVLSIVAFSQNDPSGLGTLPINNQHSPTQDDCEFCPDNSMFSNLPLPLNYAGTSDDQSCWIVYDNFSNVSGSVEQITWWGYEMYFGLPCTYFCDCTPAVPKTFEIKFYEDNAGQVGDVVGTTTVTPTKEFCITSTLYDGSESIYKYQAVLSSPVSLAAGWVSIRAIGGTDDCWFLWAGSVSDDLFARQYCDSDYSPREDFAFCLEGEAAPDVVPLSSWALILGGLLIAGFVFLRFRRLS